MRFLALISVFVLSCMTSGAATYYVSSSTGSDYNSGTSSSAPRKTLAGLSSRMKKGNSILLKRGDIFFESLSGFTDCTISDYGSGTKPMLCGFIIQKDNSSWVESSAGVWSLDLNTASNFYGHAANSKVNTYGNIGCLYDPDTDMIVGNLVSSSSSLKNEGDFYTSNEWLKAEVTSSTYSKLYLKSASRPKAYCLASGEIGMSEMTNCKISNIAVVGFGCHGMNYLYNCTITDCDIDIIGGSIMVGQNSSWARYGNGIELWISSQPCNGNLITGCQISRVYDAAVTIQGNAKDGVNPSGNRITKNRIAWCRQGFEQWTTTDGQPVIFEDCCFSDNVLYNCGNNMFSGTPTHTTDVTFLCYKYPASSLPIENNLVYASNYRYSQYNETGMRNNEVYVVAGSCLYYYYRPDEASFTISADSSVQTTLYRKYTGDNSSIKIVHKGSVEDQTADTRVSNALNYMRVAPSWTTIKQYN